MTPAAAKRFRLLASALSVLVLVALLAAGWFYLRMRASLPALDGAAKLTGLAAPVTVTRDALGVPTIQAKNRTDVARALGYLHAQDRFFQMDLQRRRAAGEIAELFGKVALPADRAARVHGFRALAQKVLAQSSPADRALIEAYTAGVNTGLASLRDKPFEYLVLRASPSAWRSEDTLLCVYSMWLTLQDSTGRYERTLMTLRDQFGADSLAFFAPVVTPDDAALDGTTAPPAPPPGPKVIDLRKRKAAVTTPTAGADALAAEFPYFPPHDPEAVIGSNAFALSGAHTATGAALVANDMHLGLGVPNIWYRASFEFPDSANQSARKITGVTLPGSPVMIAGSSGRIAWGFTVANADTGDIVVIELVPGSASLYRSPDHDLPLEIERRKEVIQVKGQEPVTVENRWTIWGPIIGDGGKNHLLAYHWTAHDPAASNLRVRDLEEAADVAAALALAPRIGMPHCNLVVGDAAGQVGWTVVGALPKRIGYDGRLPTNWSFGDRKWDGMRVPGEIPAVTTVSPVSSTAVLPSKDGRIWSANQRQIGGDGLRVLGYGAYGRPARAAQIRDDLQALERAGPRDLLGVQLDNRALFLARWQKLLVDTLTPAVVAKHDYRAELRTLAANWGGRASVDSVSYRLAREYRSAVIARIFNPIFEPCVDAFPGFDLARLNLESAVWTLLRERPAHLLDPQFSTWDDLLVAAADDVVNALDTEHVPLAKATWGTRNTLRMSHPLSRALPGWLTGWLNMPADQVPGDNDMPPALTATHGPSERFAVSPGREAEGILNMPGGQSGHPLSPYYRAGHSEWVRGEPTPFLPGPAQHTLTLAP